MVTTYCIDSHKTIIVGLDNDLVSIQPQAIIQNKGDLLHERRITIKILTLWSLGDATVILA